MVQEGVGSLSGADWTSLADWWLDELASDAAYEEQILPLALDLIDPQRGDRCLDIGCGEGRLMEAVAKQGAIPIGVDVSGELLQRASQFGRVYQRRIPPLDFLEDAAVDRAAIVLVLEHLPDEAAVFNEVARVVRRGGSLAVVLNHPLWTAPDSSPIQYEGSEILWRPGRYFSRGWSDEPAGEGTVRFFHRSLAELFNAASDTGWSLDRVVESGVSRDQVRRTPGLKGQEHIPRLMGIRWTLN